MAVKKSNKNLKKDMPKEEWRLFLIIGAIVLVIIIWYVNSALRDMDPTFKEDDTKLLSRETSPTGDIKQPLAKYWDAEELIGQQIERTLKYNETENIEKTISNIEENRSFYRNEAAVLFYLAHAYAARGNVAKANATYEEIRKKYLNGRITLYILDAPKIAATDKLYSGRIYEESYLRQAKINDDPDWLNNLNDPASCYGVINKEQFSYADLARYNRTNYARDKQFKMSYDQYIRLTMANRQIDNLIEECQKEPRGNQEQLKQKENVKDYLIDYLQTPETIDYLLDALKQSSSYQREIVFNSLRKSGVLYYYEFKVDKRLRIEAMDNGKDILINRVLGLAATESGEKNENNNQL